MTFDFTTLREEIKRAVRDAFTQISGRGSGTHRVTFRRTVYKCCPEAFVEFRNELVLKKIFFSFASRDECLQLYNNQYIICLSGRNDDLQQYLS